MLKTTVLGLLLAILYVGSGSLLLPMALHAYLDIQSGSIGAWLKSGKAGAAPA
jgi:membrane protease YdiL (CAAX protease family)